MGWSNKVRAGLEAGLFAGAVVGTAEGVWSVGPDLSSPLYGCCLYAILGALFGVFGGLLGGIWETWRGAPTGVGHALGAAAATSGLLALVLLRLANQTIHAGAGPSLGTLLGVGGALLLVDMLLLRGVLAATERFGSRALSSLFLLGPLVLGIVLAAVASIPSANHPRARLARAPGQRAVDAPSVLTIMVDTLRADHLGVYGKPGHISPHIDAFAADAIVFEDAVASASWTRPSAASLMTAMWPSAHGATTKSSKLPDAVVTCAEVQQEAGIATGALINNINLTASFGFDQGWDVFLYEAPDHPLGATASVLGLTWYQAVAEVRERLWFEHKPVGEYYQPAEVVLDDARVFIEANRDHPWALFVQLMEPHDPYFEHPYLQGTGEQEFNGVHTARSEVERPDGDQAAYLDGVYTTEITHMDRRLGRFFSWLKEEGLYDDTLIVFTSDHGEEFFEHGGWWHGTTLFEEQLHVPLIVKWPGNPHAGQRVSAQVRQLDACPTALAAQGLAAHPSWHGEDLLPLVDDADEAPRGPCDRFDPAERTAVSEIDFEAHRLRTLRSGGFKWIVANADNPRGLPAKSLFDLETDAGEQEDLAGEERLHCDTPLVDLGETLDGRLDTVFGEVQFGARDEAGCLADEEIMSLIALGYLDASGAAQLRSDCHQPSSPPPR